MKKNRWHRRNPNMPPQKDASFNDIRIMPASPELHILLDDSEGMSSPLCTAQISTYTIELSCKNNPQNALEREQFRTRSERLLKHVSRGLEFNRYNRFQPRTATITGGDAGPPVVKIRGTFTLDELNKLVELNILEANLNVAHAMKQASIAEYRGPLMKGGEEYVSRPDVSTYDRGKVDPRSEHAIGDFGAVSSDQAYAHAVKSVKEGLARGHIKGKEGFGRAVMFIAAATLKNGMLPSPYPTEAKMLTDGSQQEGSAASMREKIFEDRVLQVARDVIGPDLQLVWNAKDKTPHTDKDGPKQVTIGEFTRRVRLEKDKKIKQEKIPRWWTGDNKDWDRYIKDSIAMGTEYLMGIMRETEESGGIAAVLREIADDPDGKKMEREYLKSQLMAKHKGSKDIVAAGDIEIPTITRDDLTFFGVRHELREHYLDNGEPPDTIYVSRNPLIDPPRPLHQLLEAELKKEARRNRQKELHASSVRRNEPGERSAGH